MQNTKHNLIVKMRRHLTQENFLFFFICFTKY